MVADHCEQDVGLAPGQADEGGVVLLALGSLAVVVGPAGGAGAQRGERGHEQAVLQPLVPAAVDVLPADRGARSLRDGDEAGVGGQVRGGRERGDVTADLSQESCCDLDADSWHGRQDPGKRVDIENLLHVLGDLLVLSGTLVDHP